MSHCADALQRKLTKPKHLYWNCVIVMSFPETFNGMNDINYVNIYDVFNDNIIQG